MIDKSMIAMYPPEINNIETLQMLLILGEIHWTRYGNVYAKTFGDLTIFNYNSKAQYEGRWNWFETVSRGLILNNTTGEVIARPFDKLFNWNERGRKGTGHMMNITEKMDGSLGILYRQDGEYKIATRGSLDSDQAKWATRYLNMNFHEVLNEIPDELTLLFEVIYKDNRIVVDYGNTEGLILLAARNRETGEYLPIYPYVFELAEKFGFDLVKSWSFNSLVDIITATGEIDANQEGWVVEMSDGSRWKFKGDAYVEVHKAMSNLSVKTMLAAVQNEFMDEILTDVPDHILRLPEYFHEEAIAIRDKIIEKYVDVQGDINKVWCSINPDTMTRKEFAQWVNTEHRDLSIYLFALYDDKNIDKLVFKHAFKDWGI